ncbi:Uncharacterized protein GBIM_14589 [Gryllus bimaculatus]|nr:Uncharacterized protein GBIM_14589 [Gryllus bimaculatus]
MAVDVGQNVTLPCTDSVSLSPAIHRNSVTWARIREGKDAVPINALHTQPDGGLTLTSLNREDSGIYLCTLESKVGSTTSPLDVVRRRVKVEVRTPPPELANVTVRPSTVLALLLWDVKDDGGYPIDYFSVQYKMKYPNEHGQEDTWHDGLREPITPTVRQIDVYELEPNTTYLFKMWATNQLGPGKETILEGTTSHNMEEMELARLLLKDAKDFDTRVWVVAVVIVMGTLLILTTGTCYLLYKEYHVPASKRDDQEIIELVPNIILNPGFYEGEAHTEHIEPDENSNDQTTTRINNNTIVQPIRV